MKPTNPFKKAINSVQDWIAKADREHEEQIREIVETPLEAEEKAGKRKEGQGKILNYEDMVREVEETKEIMRETRGGGTPKVQGGSERNVTPPLGATAGSSIPPPPPRMPPPPPTGTGEAAETDSAKAQREAGGPAGLGVRDKSGRMSDKAVVAHSKDDTIYRARNQVVNMIQQRYSRYGPAVAAAVLTRAFMHNGLKLLMEKLELSHTGVPNHDHDRITGFIERHGVEEFCRRTGIRLGDGTGGRDGTNPGTNASGVQRMPTSTGWQTTPSPNASRAQTPSPGSRRPGDQTLDESDTAKERRRLAEDERRKARAALAKQRVDTGGDHKMKFQNVNIKPVTLGDKETQTPSPRPDAALPPGKLNLDPKAAEGTGASRPADSQPDAPGNNAAKQFLDDCCATGNFFLDEEEE